MISSDKILTAVIDSLSVEDLKEILRQKENKPKPIPKSRVIIDKYKEEIISKGILNQSIN